MKKFFIITIITLSILTGCTQNRQSATENQNVLSRVTQIVTQAAPKEDTFNKKIDCGKLTTDIQNQLGLLQRIKKQSNIVLDKIFYSPQYNSCLYAYVIEDDTSGPQCNLDAMSHNDTFIIKDYSTTENIFYQTKGCNNFWADSFEQEIQNLEQ